jgi:hypothetical protein
MSAKVIQQLIAQAGVTVNGDKPWDIQAYNESLYDRILRDRNLGLGEAYMDGWWDCQQCDRNTTPVSNACGSIICSPAPGLFAPGTYSSGRYS